MKHAQIFIILLSFFLFTNCDKDEEKSFQFQAIVLTKGLDCGDTFLIDVTNISGDPTIENGVYYAFDLSDDMKINGIKIQFNSRVPEIDEIRGCSMMGPTYPHIWFSDVRLIE